MLFFLEYKLVQLNKYPHCQTKMLWKRRVTPPGFCYALKSTRNNAPKFKLQHDTEESVPRNNGMNSGRSDKQEKTNGGGEEKS